MMNEIRPDGYYPEIMAWYECGEKLMENTKLSLKERKELLLDIAFHSKRRDREFMELVVAVIAAESSFNRKARSRANARGLMQVTKIGVREVVVQCEYIKIRQSKLHDSRYNVKYGTCLLDYYLKEAKGDSMAALILYNGGYKQLTKFITQGRLIKETADYVIRVNSYLRRCQ